MYFYHYHSSHVNELSITLNHTNSAKKDLQLNIIKLGLELFLQLNQINVFFWITDQFLCFSFVLIKIRIKLIFFAVQCKRMPKNYN
jgi:hypothetical protein